MRLKMWQCSLQLSLGCRDYLSPVLSHTISAQTGLPKVSLLLLHTINASPNPALSKPFEVLPFPSRSWRWDGSLVGCCFGGAGELCACLADTALPAATTLYLCAGLWVRVAEPSGWHLLPEQLSLHSPGKREQARWKCFPDWIWHFGCWSVLVCKSGWLAQTTAPHRAVSCLCASWEQTWQEGYKSSMAQPCI